MTQILRNSSWNPGHRMLHINGKFTWEHLSWNVVLNRPSMLIFRCRRRRKAGLVVFWTISSRFTRKTILYGQQHTCHVGKKIFMDNNILVMLVRSYSATFRSLQIHVARVLVDLFSFFLISICIKDSQKQFLYISSLTRFVHCKTIWAGFQVRWRT